jgi:hypothetical protein
MSVDWSGVGEALIRETRDTKRRVTEARCISCTDGLVVPGFEIEADAMSSAL